MVSNSAHAATAGISARQFPALRRKLLAWFRSNKRDLPWRRTRDPYRIWLSEIMLQQTRVAAVIPHYERFLSKFPTVQHLARARAPSVLAAWAGLGYYSRARNLHRAARKIVARHGGTFPRDREAALKLPGIGRYTAAAILSIAYGEKLAALDGNVVRVLARLDAVRSDVREPRTRRRLERRAEALLACEAPGDWNEAMMELGATICTPASPRCDECPVQRCCRAYPLGIAEKLPTARRKAVPVKIAVAAAVLFDPRGRTLMVRQPNGDGALFSRMWQFPAVEASGDARKALRDHLSRVISLDSAQADSLAEVMQPLPPARHTVTFRNIRLLPFLLRVPRLPSVEGAQTPRLASLSRLPVSNATRKIANAALRAL
jgi:A/G-specific adenine glycosylase